MIPRKITRITAENFMRLKSVDICPDGNMIYITGGNGEGKSSVLNSICAALNWRDAAGQIPEPIHKGEKKAVVSIDLGDMIATRTWTPSSTKLTVESKDGAIYPTPQAMLDKFFSRIGFDPLEFVRMQPRDQRQTLMDLLGIDFSEFETERVKILQEKSQAQNKVKSLGIQIQGLPEIPEGTPDIELSASDLIQQIQSEQKKVSEFEQSKRYYAEEIEERNLLLHQIQELETRLSSIEGSLKSREQYLSEFIIPDIAPLQEQLIQIETVNKNVRIKKQTGELLSQWEAETRNLEECNSHIISIDQDKRDALQAAKFPVSGLSFDESGILFQGIPLKQASSAEQIRVSVAIGIVMNPSLKFLIIKDGSLLDTKSRSLIADMAAEHDMQVFIEAVDESGSMGFVIEDGEVKSQTEPGQQVLA